MINKSINSFSRNTGNTVGDSYVSPVGNHDNEQTEHIEQILYDFRLRGRFGVFAAPARNENQQAIHQFLF